MSLIINVKLFDRGVKTDSMSSKQIYENSFVAPEELISDRSLDTIQEIVKIKLQEYFKDFCFSWVYWIKDKYCEDDRYNYEDQVISISLSIYGELLKDDYNTLYKIDKKSMCIYIMNKLKELELIKG